MKPHRNLTDRRSGRDRRFRDAAIPSPDRRNGIGRRKSPRLHNHLHFANPIADILPSKFRIQDTCLGSENIELYSARCLAWKKIHKNKSREW